jgi:signal transduction histidine kinase
MSSAHEAVPPRELNLFRLEDVVDRTLVRWRAAVGRRWEGSVVGTAFFGPEGRHVERALDELVANAVAATGPQDGITVSARAEAPWIEIDVTEWSPTTPAGHIGYEGEEVPEVVAACAPGMRIVEGIVAAQSGSLDITTRPGVATTFRIRLPDRPAF